MNPDSSMRGRRIAIIGSGFSGLCLAMQLKKAGLDDFTIFEKEDQLGGTWRDNIYPGAACDVPSFAYSFSFEPKVDWTRKWAGQAEILDYMDHCADRYGLLPHVRLATEIASAHFDEERGCWQLRTTAGEEHEADVLVTATGQLNRPALPEIVGLASFGGECFHSARWNPEIDLTGKRVGVIGNAASAVQLVPEIAKKTERLHVFQRSANWMMPRGDRAYRAAEIARYRKYPWLARLYRWWIWASLEMSWPIFRGNRLLGSRLEALSEKMMREVVKDPALGDALVPDYPIGGKRMLIADGYYEAITSDAVTVELDPIERISERGVVTRSGREIELDVLIFATGFATTDFLMPMQIFGRSGQSLETAWKRGAEAYLGMGVAGFPNFFMMYGPNTNLGHNSIIFMIECQTGYIMGCIRQLFRRRLKFLDLRPDVQRRFNEKLQRELARTVWAATDHSWYKQSDGRITNNWSGSTLRYWWTTRRADLSAYFLVE